MTMYVILGDGEMPAKEVGIQLDDLWQKAEAEDQNFWFVMEGKENPTPTDLELVKFFNGSGILYALTVGVGVTVSDAYTDVSEYIDIDGEFPVEELFRTLPDEGENAVLLGLFVNPVESDPGDYALIDVAAKALLGGYEVFALNDSLEKVEMTTPVAQSPEPEPEPEVKPRKRTSKKAAAKAEPPVEAEPKDPDVNPNEDFDKTFLDGLTDAELRELAKGMSIPFTTKEEVVEAMLGVTAPTAQHINEASAEAAAQAFGPQTEVAKEADAAEWEEVVPGPDGEEVTVAESVMPRNETTPVDMADPIVAAEVRSAYFAATGYEVQYSALATTNNNSYRHNYRTLVITNSIIRAANMVLDKYEGREPRIHQIVQRAEGNVLLDLSVLP